MVQGMLQWVGMPVVLVGKHSRSLQLHMLTGQAGLVGSLLGVRDTLIRNPARDLQLQFLDHGRRLNSR